MDNRNLKRQRARDPLEQKMDQWMQTGRQFVDGVAGNRPGQRNIGNSNRFNRSGVDNLGRWVGDKIDWFFEDEDDWTKSLEVQSRQAPSPSVAKKRPLEAISLRLPKVISSSIQESSIQSDFNNEWPEESSFRVNRWKRSETENLNVNKTSNNCGDTRNPKKRPLPRSNRRRN